MKNVLKLSFLITGLSLCMMENPTQESQVTRVYTMSGNELFSIVNEDITVFELTAKLEAQNPTAELGKIVFAISLVHEGKKLSSDEIIFRGSYINAVYSEQKVELLVQIQKYTDITVTLYDNLDAISGAELGNDFNTLEEYIDYWYTENQDIYIDNLFLNNGHKLTVLDNISKHLTKIVTSRGQIFMKVPNRSNYCAPDSALSVLREIYKSTIEACQITQGKIDYSIYRMAWVVLPTTESN